MMSLCRGMSCKCSTQYTCSYPVACITLPAEQVMTWQSSASSVSSFCFFPPALKRRRAMVFQGEAGERTVRCEGQSGAVSQKHLQIILNDCCCKTVHFSKKVQAVVCDSCKEVSGWFTLTAVLASQVQRCPTGSGDSINGSGATSIEECRGDTSNMQPTNLPTNQFPTFKLF